MIELALVVMMGSIMALLWSQRKQQTELHQLQAMQPTVIEKIQHQPRKMSPSERRIALLVDDAETLMRQILTRKPHSRLFCCERLGFSEYRWNRSSRLLKSLDISDGNTMLVSYAEARLRIRRYLEDQVALAKVSDTFVPSV